MKEGWICNGFGTGSEAVDVGALEGVARINCEEPSEDVRLLFAVPLLCPESLVIETSSTPVVPEVLGLLLRLFDGASPPDSFRFPRNSAGIGSAEGGSGCRLVDRTCLTAGFLTDGAEERVARERVRVATPAEYIAGWMRETGGGRQAMFGR